MILPVVVGLQSGDPTTALNGIERLKHGHRTRRTRIDFATPDVTSIQQAIIDHRSSGNDLNYPERLNP